MRSKLFTFVLVGVVAFLLATNPMVGNAAGMITGSQIKNNSITGKDIKNHSLKSGDFAAGQIPAGPAGPQGPQGAQGNPGASATALWAVVQTSATGVTIIRSAGAVSATRTGTGSYFVTFNRSILACAYLASAGDVGDGSADPNYATVEQRDATNNPNAVEVRVLNANGTQVDATSTDGFHVAVFCP